MMYKRRSQHESLCVLRIDVSVLDLPGTVVTDQNAASDYVRFAAAPEGLRIVNEELTFAEDWTHPERIEYYRRKSAKNAEVLVADHVASTLIVGAYVSTEAGQTRVAAMDPALDVKINAHMFFQGS